MDVFVIFGITGDLAKVMTFHSLYRLEQRGLLDCPIVGVAVDDWTVDQLVERARTSIEGTGEKLHPKVFDRFAARLSYTGARAPSAAFATVVRLDPTTGAQLSVDARHADRPEAEAITLDMEFAEQCGEGATPYEVLLHAAMVGNSTRFTRQDGVEQTWRVMQPLLDAPPPVHPYKPGSLGPAAADELVAGHGRWHGPWITA